MTTAISYHCWHPVLHPPRVTSTCLEPHRRPLQPHTPRAPIRSKVAKILAYVRHLVPSLLTATPAIVSLAPPLGHRALNIIILRSYSAVEQEAYSKTTQNNKTKTKKTGQEHEKKKALAGIEPVSVAVVPKVSRAYHAFQAPSISSS